MASTETPIASFSSPNGTAEGNGRQQEEASSKNHPSPVEVEYDSPPPSWFFSRGSSKTSNANKNATNNSNTEGEAKQPAFSANISRSDVSSSSSSAKIDQPFSSQQRISGTSTNYTNADWGMVSDNEDDYEGFNFVAVTKSLVDLSYEQVTESKVVTTNDGNGNEDSGSCQRGVLIVDGLSSINSYEEVVGNANHEASELTIPGSDSLPSEIGSIGHHDYDDRDPLFGTIEGVDPPAENPGHQNRSTGFPEFRPLTSRPSFSRIPSRMHTVSIPRFTTRKKNNCEDEGEDKSESGDTTWSSVKVIEERFVRAPLRLLSKRRLQRRTVSMFLVALLLAALSGRSYVVNQRKQREVWEERLRLEAEARERLQAEKEALRLEMELLQEEAAVATARAESLAMEQERLLIQREEAERERTRLLKEENERLERERQNQQRRRQQPWRSDSEDGEGDFGWSFGDDNENCSGKRGNKDGSTTFTVADNCWIKAKADIDFGSCGDESYNFFGDIWKGLWEDWEYYFDEPNSVATAAATSSAGANWQEEGREGGEQYQDDTYYPPQDPLQDLYSVIHTAGQSLVTKMSDFIADEIESSSRTVQDVEDAVSRRYSETTKTVSEAMEVAKEDMRDLSKEALLVLRAAVKKRSNGNNRGSDKTGAPPPNSNNKSEYGVPREEVSTATKPRAQEVTRQELLDAAAAVATLSKTWQETTKSIFAAEDA
mmetsp:Transcript_17091/g.39369  ORF Transcript_17091/g.39369 Transcript_17091/m.39369 type:complete len:714 (-) Transcript_17091:1960-4101(-)|eukprot:CAMPEP_0201118200 /NCGR_PEP_ID=MMETSP0850-20130426/2315_1 /ASSEMBLY_ACC=CAM_ASM_000622 /TAXON_ID=183588 /ORGANISM="Pseudo-nitzschia fraudulenta, Strain WWA7" /LENGTH=713 /DNA_ID=CAMNT_0047383203 /DNA_START=175 /DNA_END=2316 /DNA_ORIENTATION=+